MCVKVCVFTSFAKFMFLLIKGFRVLSILLIFIITSFGFVDLFNFVFIAFFPLTVVISIV